MVAEERHVASGCPFCAIAAGSQPADVVWESPELIAFLDSRPLARGHCLVAPRAHVSTFLDLPEQLAGPLLEAVRALAHAVEGALAVDGSLVAINVKVSQSVPHLHVHVVPRRRGDWLLLRLVLRRRVYRDVADRRSVAAALAARLAQ